MIAQQFLIYDFLSFLAIFSFSISIFVVVQGKSYWVGNDSDESLRADFSSSSGQISHNGGIDVEEIISGHARLAGNTSRDDDDLAPFKRSL